MTTSQGSVHISVPVVGRWDVLVAGAGPAGCTAAAAAARAGRKVLLVEATGVLGGMGTSGLLPAWCPFSDGETMIYRGLAEEVFRGACRGVPHIDPKQLDWVPIDTERLKRVYDDLVCGSGVDLLLQTAIAGVLTDGAGRVMSALLANKSGLTAVGAEVFVDATGDGDLAVWAGAEWKKGDAAGVMQPVTHCFQLANVDTYAYLHGGRPWKSALPIEAVVKKYPRVSDLFMCNALVGPGVVGFNTGHQWDVDGTEPRSVSAALVEGRKIAGEFLAMFAEYWPAAFAGAFLAATAPLLGVRETRRIMGDHVLTWEDYAARRSFEDEIGRNSYPVDIHTAKDEIGDALSGKLQVMERFEQYKPGESHGIPYRTLIPRGLRNVLVAGRCLSSDRPVQASVRVMPVCLVTGQAAGTAAALACAAGGDVRAVGAVPLREALRKGGAWLP